MGSLVRQGSAGLLPYNLPHLQNLIKRDPESYNEEFDRQYSRYKSMLELFLLDPTQPVNTEFCELVQFLSAISNCYAKIMIPEFPDSVADVLTQHAVLLHYDTRLSLCRVLITLRNKNLLEPLVLHKLFFHLFMIPDKTLRETLYNFIVNDIKSINVKSKNNALNKGIQSFLFTIIHQNSNKVTCKMAVDLLVELYKRNIWRDQKTVNVLASGCFNKFSSVARACLNFFIQAGSKQVDDSDHETDSDDDDNPLLTGPTAKQYIMRQIGASAKNTKKMNKKKAKAAILLEKLKAKSKRIKASDAGNFAALHIIHDPQDFGERLFKTMQRTKEKFDTKILYLELVSKLIGMHQLFILNFYPYCEKWLTPQQRNVTKVLVSLAQASHDLVPPEILQQTIKTIADNFVTERNSSEVMGVGINAIREISNRCPLAMTEELLQDLAQYKKHVKKAVSAAAKSLISVFREKNKSMLSRKDQGRPDDSLDSSTPAVYGETKTVSQIPGMADICDGNENVGQHGVLSQDDFELMKIKQLKRKLKLKDVPDGPVSKRQRTDGDDSDSDEVCEDEANDANIKSDVMEMREKFTRKELVSDKDVLFVVGAKRAKDYNTRMQSILNGREDKSQYKIKSKIAENHVGTGTNKQKEKKKAFTMVKHKFNRNSSGRSYSEKATALRDALKKQKNRAHKNKF